MDRGVNNWCVDFAPVLGYAFFRIYLRGRRNAAPGLEDCIRHDVVGVYGAAGLRQVAVVRPVLHHDKVAAVLAVRVCIDAALERYTLASGQRDAVLGLQRLAALLLDRLGSGQYRCLCGNIVAKGDVFCIFNLEITSDLHLFLDGHILALACNGKVARRVRLHLAVFIIDIVASSDVNITFRVDSAADLVLRVGELDTALVRLEIGRHLRRHLAGNVNSLCRCDGQRAGITCGQRSRRLDSAYRINRQLVRSGNRSRLCHKYAGGIVRINAKGGIAVAERRSIGRLERHILSAHSAIDGHALAAGHRNAIGLVRASGGNGPCQQL